MFDSILNFFRDDPLILKGFWSVVFLFIVFLIFIVSRRVIQRFRIEEEKQNLIRKWVHAVVLILYLVVLIRIWLYDFLIQISHPRFWLKSS